MKDYIRINGISSQNINVWIDTPPIPPKAEKKTQTVVIPGREDVITSNGEYEDIPINVTAWVFERNYDPADLYQFVENAKTLRTSLHYGFYYKVKKVMGIVPVYQGNGKYMLTLSFLCDPYKYSVDKTVHEETSKTFTITNDGTTYCKPIYTVYGSGTVKIKASDDANEITLYNVNGVATVDCERLIAYDSDKHLLTTSGIFPFLNVGDNEITIDGDVSKVEYMTNERWL